MMNNIRDLSTANDNPWNREIIDLSADHAIDEVPAFELGKFGPAIAEQYAATICCYWRSALSHGEIAQGTALDVIDLCPTEGSAGLLSRAIGRRLNGTQSFKFRYVPVLRGREGAPAALEIGSERPFALWPGASLAWNPKLPDAWPVWRGTGARYSPSNPVVVLAHDAWAQAGQSLYAIHYGKLLRANLQLLAEDDATQSNDLWQGAGDSEWDDALTGVLKRYMVELNSSPIAYPAGAMRIMQKLIAVSAQPLLFIAKAAGQNDELEIRLGSFRAVTQEYWRSGNLPVNFHLIEKWADSHSGASSGIRVGGRDYLQMNFFGVPNPVDRIEKIARCIEPALFSGAEQLVAVTRALGPGASLEARMNLLQLSRYDPAVFLASNKELIAAFAKAQEFDRKSWRGALQQVWENRGACPEEADLHKHIATAAMHCGHWGFARHVLRQGLQRFGENATDLAHLAWCEVRTGQLARGEELLHQALNLDKANQLALQVAARLTERAKARDGRWRTCLQHQRLPLVLEPLDENHLDAYFHQYRDPQIAVMTGLPALNSIEETRTWFAAQAGEAGKVNFAVMHEDWGFVGFVNLAVSENAAFFCFWIGVDFQGMGISSAAGRLVCQYAAALGVPVMLTSAYKDNHRSIRALKRIGFLELATRALPPDQDRIFFSLIDQSAGAVDSHIELVNYYQRENLPMQFVFPAEAGGMEINHVEESS